MSHCHVGTRPSAMPGEGSRVQRGDTASRKRICSVQRGRELCILRGRRGRGWLDIIHKQNSTKRLINISFAGINQFQGRRGAVVGRQMSSRSLITGLPVHFNCTLFTPIHYTLYTKLMHWYVLPMPWFPPGTPISNHSPVRLIGDSEFVLCVSSCSF